MSSKQHWDSVYGTKSSESVSWYQEYPQKSLQFIRETKAPVSARVIDVGGGDSRLVDELLQYGYTALTVLDISRIALTNTQQRLGPASQHINWIASNMLHAELPYQYYNIWHDRAAFHFLTTPSQRRAYIEKAFDAIAPGGHLFIATFADDGPERCSGLPVVRYNKTTLSAEFAGAFKPVKYADDEHVTPTGSIQKFLYAYFRK